MSSAARGQIVVSESDDLTRWSDGRVVIESDAGPRPSTLVERQDVTVRVAVEMGVAKVSAAADVPTDAGVQAVTAGDMGNPHGGLFAPVGDRDFGRALHVDAAVVGREGAVSVRDKNPAASSAF